MSWSERVWFQWMNNYDRLPRWKQIAAWWLRIWRLHSSKKEFFFQTPLFGFRFMNGAPEIDRAVWVWGQHFWVTYGVPRSRGVGARLWEWKRVTKEKRYWEFTN